MDQPTLLELLTNRAPKSLCYDTEDTLIDDDTVIDTVIDPNSSITIDTLESKIYSNVKSTSIQDLFKKHKQTRLVTIKLKSRYLQNIQQNLNPYSLVVKLRVNPGDLKRIKQYENPLKTRGTIQEGKSVQNLFSDMMQASRKQKLSPLQNLKELEPLNLTRELLHVNDIDRNYTPPRDKRIPQLHELSGWVPSGQNKPVPSKYCYEKTPCTIIKPHDWSENFKPNNVKELLLDPKNISEIFDWINLAFENLQRYGPIKDLKKKLKQKSTDSFGNDLEEIPDYSPFLILQGSLGCGKSTSVYTCMKEINGYVHEINAGQSRNKKDLYQNLKEFVTTQLVNNMEKGLVLLEDVNILFEQDAKFWSLVSEIINITQRPIILTCEELWNIPRNLIDFAREEDSIIFLDDYKVGKNVVKDYLKLRCASANVEVDEILDDIIDENDNGVIDIRGCMMQCEFLCKGIAGHKITPRKNESTQCFNLDSLTNLLEVQSCSDVIEQTESSHLQEYNVNELVDIYIVDDLYKNPLPYELNIGEELSKMVPIDKSVPESRYFFSDLRYEVKRFIGSRDRVFKEKPSRQQSLDSVGISDSSFLNYITITPLVLDVLPYARAWQSFQNELDDYDYANPDKPSLKKFLSYRDFKYPSTLQSTIISI